MFKKLRKNEKGFTLAELLIVVAIIGVLVAISIPIFTSQLEKAREATDMANLRSAYAECSASLLTGEANDGVALTPTTGDPTSASKSVTLCQQTTGWLSDVEIAGKKTNTDKIPSSGTVEVTVTATGVTFATK